MAEPPSQPPNQAPLQTRQIDLSQLANATSGEVKVKVESPEEISSGVRKNERQHTHDLWRDTVLLCVGVAGSAVVLAVSLYLIASPTSTPEAKEWAKAALPSLLTAFLGYLAGKKSGGSEE